MGVPINQFTISEHSDSNAVNKYIKQNHENARLALLTLNSHNSIDVDDWNLDPRSSISRDLPVDNTGSTEGCTSDSGSCPVRATSISTHGDVLIESSSSKDNCDSSDAQSCSINENSGLGNNDLNNSDKSYNSDSNSIDSMSCRVLLERGSATAGGAKARRLLLRAMQLLR